MQISQVSSNNVAVGNQPQTNTLNIEKPQTPETDQQPNKFSNTDKVTISPQAQRAQQGVESDGYGTVYKPPESNVTELANQANSNLNSSEFGITKVDIFA